MTGRLFLRDVALNKRVAVGVGLGMHAETGSIARQVLVAIAFITAAAVIGRSEQATAVAPRIAAPPISALREPVVAAPKQIDPTEAEIHAREVRLRARAEAAAKWVRAHPGRTMRLHRLLVSRLGVSARELEARREVECNLTVAGVSR